MNNFYPQQDSWLQKAQSLTPRMNYRKVLPLKQIDWVPAPGAWQGVAIEEKAPVEEAFQEFFQFRTFRFDFGEHLVGRLEFELEYSRCPDAPVRVIAKFAETPYEFSCDFTACKSHLDHSWMQLESRIFDDAPDKVKLERRYACRYLELKLGSPNYHTHLKSLCFIAETSAGECIPCPVNLSGLDAKIDRTATLTLRDCMQSVFEDGPKRDRRLWIGDMWQQAKVNGCTFRNYELVERSLYLAASQAGEDGMLPGSIILQGDHCHATNIVPTYALLAGPILHDHYNFYQREDFCREMLPLALRQQEIFREAINPDGTLQPRNWWLFIDHDQQWLKPQTAALCCYIYSLRETAELMKKLNINGYQSMMLQADELSKKLRHRLWDEDRRLMRTDGQDGEDSFSWATQAWMLLAAVPTPEQAQSIWKTALHDKKIRQGRTPFIWGTIAEAGCKIGQIDDALELVRDYWGGMIRRGADTFWEVYRPDDDLFTSYSDPMMNSACHAWSCMAGYILRKYVK